jgi:hypothetical protein
LITSPVRLKEMIASKSDKLRPEAFPTGLSGLTGLAFSATAGLRRNA